MITKIQHGTDVLYVDCQEVYEITPKAVGHTIIKYRNAPPTTTCIPANIVRKAINADLAVLRKEIFAAHIEGNRKEIKT